MAQGQDSGSTAMDGAEAAPPLLIFRLGSLGDTIVALPCFHAIERAFPRHRRIVLTNIPVSAKAPRLESILRPGHFIHGVIEYPIGLRSLRALWALRQQISATGARTMVYLAEPRGLRATWRDALFFHLCGIRRIIGLPLSRDQQRCREGAEGVEPEAERLARTLTDLGPVDLADRRNWDLRLTAAEQAQAEAVLTPLAGTPFIAINMGGKAAIRDWGEDHWRALIDRAAQRHGAMGLVAVGSREDWERSAAILAGWPGPTVNLCGTLAPRESSAVLGRCALFVGHDSGPLHLAAAAGAPVIGLFGSLHRPRQWHPYSPHALIHHDMRGVRAITVDQVAASLDRMLG